MRCEKSHRARIVYDWLEMYVFLFARGRVIHQVITRNYFCQPTENALMRRGTFHLCIRGKHKALLSMLDFKYTRALRAFEMYITLAYLLYIVTRFKCVRAEAEREMQKVIKSRVMSVQVKLVNGETPQHANLLRL
jgi:hypothetical protein